MKTKIIALLSLAFFFNSFVCAQTIAQPPPKKKVQLALLLDTSSSMNGLIDQAKSQLWTIVNEMVELRFEGEVPTLEIALYEYGNDGLSSASNYIRQVAAFTTDLDLISEKLFALTINGGSEYCGAVISKSLSELKWSSNNSDLKIIFIAGNEGFNQGGVDYEDACKGAINSGVVVNTIYCGGHADGINLLWKHGADLASGKYMNIDHNQAIVFIATPFDQEIETLNIRLNQTYIFYGSLGASMKQRQSEQDNNAGKFGSANMANRAVSKSNGAYNNENWDVVDYSKGNDVTKMKVEDLPEEMRKMTPEERVAYVQKLSEERKCIQQQILIADQKRQEYIAQNSTQKNEFHGAVVTVIQEQAKSKSFVYSKTK